MSDDSQQAQSRQITSARQRIFLILLFAAHFAAIVVLWILHTPSVLVRLFIFRYDEDFFHTFLAYGIWISDASLVALWCGLGTNSWRWRLLLALVAYGAITLNYFLFPQFVEYHAYLRSFSAIVIAPAVFTFGAVLLFRRAGYRLHWQCSVKPRKESLNGFRFSILELLGFTATVALFITALRMLYAVGQKLDVMPPKLAHLCAYVVLGFIYAFPCFAAALSLLSLGHVIWRLYVAVCVVTFALCIYLISPPDLPVSLIFASATATSFVSLMVIRCCGYRLEKPSRQCAEVQSA